MTARQNLISDAATLIALKMMEVHFINEGIQNGKDFYKHSLKEFPSLKKLSDEIDQQIKIQHKKLLKQLATQLIPQDKS